MPVLNQTCEIRGSQRPATLPIQRRRTLASRSAHQQPVAGVVVSVALHATLGLMMLQFHRETGGGSPSTNDVTAQATEEQGLLHVQFDTDAYDEECVPPVFFEATLPPTPEQSDFGDVSALLANSGACSGVCAATVDNPTERPDENPQKPTERVDAVTTPGSTSPTAENTPSSPSTPTESEPAALAARADWEAIVRKRLGDAAHYPALARRAGCEGVVKLEFDVDAAGNISNVRVVAGSGSDILDNGARESVERCSPLPPPPKGDVHLLFSFRYRLDDHA